MPSSENNNDDWILAPILGILGLVGAYVFSNMNNSQPQTNNGLPPPPPPPPNGKPGGCGCQAGKKQN